MSRYPCLTRNPKMTLLDTKLSKSLLKSYSIKPFAIRGTSASSYTTHNIELNSHSLVRETGSRPTPYHWPCFARQPRSTSFPPIPLKNKSQLKRTLKKFVKRIISIFAHILVDVEFFDVIQSVYIFFICLFWQYLSAETAQF